MNRINYLFKRVQCWVQSGIFGYCGNGTGNRVHTPLYIGGVPCTHLNTHNHSTHLKNAVLKEGYPPLLLKSVNDGRLLHLKIFSP